jgi:hypothetical protein
MPSSSFLSNHGAMLILIASQPQITAVEIGSQLSITERPVRRIIPELETAGYLRRQREDRVNRDDVNPSLLLPGPVLKNMAVGDLLGILRSISGLPSGSQPEVDLKNPRSNSPSFRPVESAWPSESQLSGEPRLNGTDSLTGTS